MKDSALRIAVCSRSFSRNSRLREALKSQFRDVKFNDEGITLAGDSLIEFLGDCDMAITALERIDEYVLSQLPRLKRISKYGVGLDMIDLEALKRYQKQLAWKAGVNRRSVAELALTMMLTIIRKIPESQAQIASGNWAQTVGNTLSGKTIGIVGCGNIGQDLFSLLKPFGCQMLVNDINESYEFFSMNDLEVTPLTQLLSHSDIVTLHLPLDESTRHILSRAQLQEMKMGSILVNTARGGLIDEDALFDEIQKGRIVGAGLDVFEEEPPFSNKLLSFTQVVSTAHIGGSSEEAILEMGMAAIEGLSADRALLYLG
ncbi:MAG: phosphoglycerate dehydrogenase [Alphaproteobacteria bacterium]